MMAALTPLGIAALGLLAERAMHPYEMYQLLIQRREDRVVKVRPGSLYHAVDRLALQGFASITGTEREGNRPERTNYEITDAGRSALASTIAEMLQSPVNEYPRFPLAVSECHNLPRDQVVVLLGARLTALDLDLATIDAAVLEATTRGVERRYLLDASYQVSVIRAEIEWITLAIAEIESGELAWLSDNDCLYRYPQ